MNYAIFTTLALLSIGALGCGASVSGAVQVYTGPLSSVQTPASTLAELHVARSIAEKTRGELVDSVDDANKSVLELKQSFQDASAALQGIASDSAYSGAFKGYRDAWIAYISAVSKADAKTPKQLFSLPDVKKAIDALRAQLTGTIAGKSRRVLVRPFYGALLDKAGTEEAALTALDVVACLTCVKGSGEGVDALNADQVSLFTGNAADDSLTKLEGLIKDAPAPQPIELTGQKNGLKSVEQLEARVGGAKAALEAPALQAAWKEVDAAMIDAEKALTAARPSSDSGSGSQVAQSARDANAIAHARLRAYAGEIEKLQLDASNITRDLKVAGYFFEQPEVASLVKDPPNLVQLSKSVDAAILILKKSPQQIRISANLVGKPGFDATDPNVPKLAEELWKEEPVDTFRVAAGGESDFVIVQESPTRFTVKQLRFDPKANAELGVSIADLGLDIATTIVQQTTGVKVGTSSAEDSSGQGMTGDARKRIADDCRASLRAMSSSLGAEIEKAEKKTGAVEPALLGRIRGLLLGHHSLLAACTSALGKASSSAPETK